jgi:CRISP-associated protein Cas1
MCETEASKIRNRRPINEVSYVIPLSRRHPFFYLEHCKIIRKDNDIRILTVKEKEDVEVTLPVANIGALILGPGCSITTEAAKISTTRGCLLCFSGGQSLPIFLVSNQHRSPLSRIRQHECVFDAEKRKKAANVLFERRGQFIKKYSECKLYPFPKGDSSPTIETMMSEEAVWAKQSYRMLAKTHEVLWISKKIEDESRKNPITFLNFLSYSVADIVIHHLGYDPNIGILHGRTKGGGLCYDLADIIKPVLALVPSFKARQEEKSLKKIKSDFIAKTIEYDVISYLIKTLCLVFKD